MDRDAPRALVLTGAGRYADPWHPFARTSARIVGLLVDDGFAVTESDDIDEALRHLDVDLLVVNAGDPWRNSEPVDAPLDSGGLRLALDRGIGVLAMHAALSSLRDYDSWAAATGAVWLPKVSWHPPAGPTEIALRDAFGSRAGAFRIEDERYCRLQHTGAFQVVAEHVEGGETFPLVWVREHGPSRIAVDLLGHDERSYDAAEHRTLLRGLARWAIGDRVWPLPPDEDR